MEDIPNSQGAARSGRRHITVLTCGMRSRAVAQFLVHTNPTGGSPNRLSIDPAVIGDCAVTKRKTGLRHTHTRHAHTSPPPTSTIRARPQQHKGQSKYKAKHEKRRKAILSLSSPSHGTVSCVCAPAARTTLGVGRGHRAVKRVISVTRCECELGVGAATDTTVGTGHGRWRAWRDATEDRATDEAYCARRGE